MTLRQPLAALRPLLLLAFALTLLPAAQARAADAVATARAQQVAVYALARDFHMETLLAGDPARTAALKKRVADMDAGFAALGGDAWAAARTEWAAYRKLALANNIVQDEYTDENLVGDLYLAADRLDKALGAALAAQAKNPGQAGAVHATNLLLQRTSAGYLKRAAAMSPDIGAEDSFDVGAAAQKLDKDLFVLAKQLSADKARADEMRTLLAKWSFIKPSLVNYNERAVPFIVDRNTEQLGNSLSSLTNALAGQ